MLAFKLLFWVSFSVILLVLGQLQQLSSLNKFLATLAIPFHYTAAWPHRVLLSLQTNLASRQALLDENAQLRNQALIQQVQLQHLLALEKENHHLRLLLKATQTMNNQRFLIAQIMEVAADSFVHEVLLDKGSTTGVYVGQPVLDANGVMGQVIQVTPVTSRVLLITDIRSAIPVQNNRTGNRSIALGTGNPGQLKLIHVPITTDIRAGDLLFTSGLGKRYPAGYPVGVVTRVTHKPEQQFANITVSPSAQINRAEQVILLWPSKNSTAPYPAIFTRLPLTTAQRHYAQS